MKVLYNTCFADPWIKVAKELKDKHGLEPTYWIGNQFDDSDKLVPRAFPECWYFPRLDIWRGIFPKEITEHWQDVEFDIDFLREIGTYELQAIKMMDRMDNDQHSFSFMERQRLFRNNLKMWSAFLKNNKVDLIIGAIVPHRAYDYPLYLLSQKMNIPFIFFKNSAFLGRIVLSQDIYAISEKVDKEYRKILASGVSSEECKEQIEEDILNVYTKVQGNYSQAIPGYMKAHAVRDRQESNIFGLAQRLFKLLSDNREKYFGKEAYFFKGVPSYYKEKNKPIEKSRLSLYAHIFRKRKGVKIKKKLRTYYAERAIEPDYNKNYVFLPLHYQPEMTSNPSGDIFVDQLLCVDVLASNIPNDCILYVKEHPSQFLAHTAGHTSRLKEHYDDMLKYKNVRLVPIDTNPFHLIKNSKAVATITGTAGWEAMVLKKPVIIFGLSWYEYYSGVLKITNLAAAKKIAAFIREFKFDERDLMAYLKAFQDNSTVSYFDLGLKDQMSISEEASVNNLVKYIQRCIK